MNGAPDSCLESGLFARSGFAVDFRPPPTHSYEQKAPILKEFWGLAFKGVADELENPSDEK